jgi:hypothetical protein
LIDKRSVEHWTSIIKQGALVPSLIDPSKQSPEQQALTVLIASAWVDGAALRGGLRPSRGEIMHVIEETRASSPGGRVGFMHALKETGQTLADVEGEARARWAARALAHQLALEAEQLARAQVRNSVVVAFYQEHIARYHLRERRYYDLIERIPTRAAARTLAKRIGISERFVKHSSKERPYRPRSFAGLPGQATVYRAVFAAKRTGVIVGPLPLQGLWSLFVLRRIVPARLQPLSEVYAEIERSLLGIARRKATAELIGAYERRWVAMTDCRPGYVVQKCRQYAGSRRPEPAPFAGF